MTQPSVFNPTGRSGEEPEEVTSPSIKSVEDISGSVRGQTEEGGHCFSACLASALSIMNAKNRTTEEMVRILREAGVKFDQNNGLTLSGENEERILKKIREFGFTFEHLTRTQQFDISDEIMKEGNVSILLDGNHWILSTGKLENGNLIVMNPTMEGGHFELITTEELKGIQKAIIITRLFQPAGRNDSPSEVFRPKNEP